MVGGVWTILSYFPLLGILDRIKTFLGEYLLWWQAALVDVLFGMFTF